MFSPADLFRAAVFSMGPESRARDSVRGPELSHREDGSGRTQEQDKPHCPCNHVLGQDCLDGQILGQLRPLSEEEESSGAAFLGEPAFPEMDSEDLRLASFYDWPSTAGIQPEPLAAAGFFHTGQQDKVRCFFCYGGLQSWERGDDPWTEHARWFPRCQFLLRSKGRDFVERIQTYTPLLGSWDQREEPEDAVSATPSAPAHGSPELLRSRRETQPEDVSEPGAKDVQEQLRQLQEERRCKVCLDRAVSIVFVPCGHFVCTECAPNLQLCPICRVPICSCVRTFLS
ncbi:baculoviral IAP repeat-containing protein 7 precursor [Mus musculus]|uniref:Baculoviral IAP repeat-containing protein 7 n=1 Tax=Mus musculus TaxID=10090 RepID=BIRC7_MOUSE|nr:baculoviral IAP repeat-containing protein 7 precursor [Mus musculus]A2AWP0.1 RecName: Full=Baculoviral IAP repeat-containing protein 7; AltName: Full=Livin; AltName: Full=RING-type E3 ubiquitin transferase BIRC7; Contains: RecName: Full=Baculoviral IAP repeat-containing protein 7 30 kDa subunit; Short=Truncated livin; Short=p30-Livin; Short=tLivin [Mus musculus]|eukprot:NP_001156719.1 baculoviral IAP repeat-containing protein 7 precursor [Mus musculus]